MLELIVNADDFGLNANINEAIERCFREGILTSASLMANGKAFDEAVKIAKNTDLDVGIHFGLVQGKPICNSYQVASLIDHDGKFFSNSKIFIKNYLLGRISINDIEKELLSQAEKILDTGLLISHLDSHQHLHLLPKILEVINKISKKYSIKFVRLPKEPIQRYMISDGYINSIAQLASINVFCWRVKNKIAQTTDRFAGFYFGGRLTVTNLISILKNLPNQGTCELMCHPGIPKNNSNNEIGGYRLVEEADALTSDEIKWLIKKLGINIISFRDLLK